MVLVRACRDTERMPEHVSVAIDFSPTRFAKSDVVKSIIFWLADTVLPETRLEIEIADGVPLDKNQPNLKTL